MFSANSFYVLLIFLLDLRMNPGTIVEAPFVRESDQLLQKPKGKMYKMYLNGIQNSFYNLTLTF